MKEKRKIKELFRDKGSFFMMLGILLCMQLFLLFYYGEQKAGYHEDEYYSYYSTNRTAGLYVPDREWVASETYEKEFVVEQGEGYNYKLVSQVQSWDVHPPIYYFLIHTVSSLFSGIFSKWIGIGINMVAFTINFGLLAWLGYMVTEKNKKITLLICAVHGFNAAIISGVMFIRMYEWLTLFVLICACLHVRAMKQEDMRWRSFLIPLMATIYLGFLTQYYYIIFHVFIGIGFCAWLLVKKRSFLSCMKYGISCAAALSFAVITYPASLSHIFRGYRGSGAVTEFLDSGNTDDRLSFFIGLVNEYLFDGFLPLLVLVIVLMVVILSILKRKQKVRGLVEKRMDKGTFYLLAFAVGGYFFTVSKTALILYETSNRYQLPVYGILMLLIIVAVFVLGSGILAALNTKSRVRMLCFFAMAALFLLTDVHELVSGKVLFLYEEDRAAIDYAKENEKTAVIVLYNEETPYHVWWCAGQLMAHDKAYFMSQGSLVPITDVTLQNADKIIVYAADHELQEENLTMVMEGNKKITRYKRISQKSLWTVYEMN